MQLTARGKRLSLLAGILAASSILFTDAILATAAIILALLICTEWYRTRAAASKFGSAVTIEGEQIGPRMVAGETRHSKLNAKSTLKLGVSVSPPFEWSSVSPREMREKETQMDLTLSPMLAGTYSSSGFPAVLSSRHGLVETAQKCTFQLEVEVYPRVLPIIAEVLEFLVKAGSRSAGDQPVDVKGRGLEYAWTRAYAAGDDLHFVDHKATAKRGKLMIKEFYAETGLVAHLMYDTRAAGPISGDELTSAFLNTALDLAKHETPFGLTIHDGERILFHASPRDSTTALEAALKHVLGIIKVDPQDLDSLLDPGTSAQAKFLMARLRSSNAANFIKASVRNLKAPYLAVKIASENSSAPTNAIAITGLMGGLAPYFELSNALTTKAGSLKLVSPCKPWLEAEALEEAYRLYSRHRRAKKLLEAVGIAVEENVVRPWRH